MSSRSKARGPGLVARRHGLHRRDVQERREDDVRQGASSTIRRASSTRVSRATQGAPSITRRGDRRGSVEGARSCGRRPEYVQGLTVSRRPPLAWRQSGHACGSRGSAKASRRRTAREVRRVADEHHRAPAATNRCRRSCASRGRSRSTGAAPAVSDHAAGASRRRRARSGGTCSSS